MPQPMIHAAHLLQRPHRPLRIGIMCHAGAGGSVRIATGLAAALAAGGHAVHLIARSVPFGDWNSSGAVTVHTPPQAAATTVPTAELHTDWPREEREAFLALVLRVQAAVQLDVLHFHYAVPFAFIAADVRRRLGADAPLLVGTLHGTDVSRNSAATAEGQTLAQAFGALDSLTTVSQNHADLAQAVFGLAAPPLVIPNFIDLAAFRPASWRSRTRRVGPPRIAHVSNFRAVKDPLAMARLFTAIHQACGAELWLIGDGPLLGAVQAAFEQAGVAAAVRYWGLQAAVGPLLAQTQLLLMTSQAESFCMAALEAMACGVPVVAPAVGGLPEVVTHGQTGFLYAPDDAAGAVWGALGLLDDRIRHQALARAARRHARRYAPQHIIPRYETVYYTLLRQHAPALNAAGYLARVLAHAVSQPATAI
ncbi:MAG: glycosyltransferase [Chloroflexota bacterium]|nr:glycosyltransferase [Chloroflexota bacterium]